MIAWIVTVDKMLKLIVKLVRTEKASKVLLKRQKRGNIVKIIIITIEMDTSYKYLCDANDAISWMCYINYRMGKNAPWIHEFIAMFLKHSDCYSDSVKLMYSFCKSNFLEQLKYIICFCTNIYLFSQNVSWITNIFRITICDRFFLNNELNEENIQSVIKNIH